MSALTSETTANLARPHFLATEQTLSGTLGTETPAPVRLFDVGGLGVDFDELCAQVLPSFAQLPWDGYDARRERSDFLRSRFPEHEPALADWFPAYFAGERPLEDFDHLVKRLTADEHVAFDGIRPYRRRAIATFSVTKSRLAAVGWRIERDGDSTFCQASDHDGDFRQLERRFAPSATVVTDAPAYRAMIAAVANLVDSVKPGGLRRARIACHQMGLVTRPVGTATNAPEGIHQDGADYIVSALVLERSGIEGGESVVFGDDKRTEYLRHPLQEGQGLVQADAGSPLWHWVTPVRTADPGQELAGKRNVLGYDIHVDE